MFILFILQHAIRSERIFTEKTTVYVFTFDCETLFEVKPNNYKS